MAAAVAGRRAGQGRAGRAFGRRPYGCGGASAYDAAAFGFSPACEAALLPVYVRALRRFAAAVWPYSAFGRDDGGVFADTLEKICGYAKAVWRGACFCASPSEEALGRCGALGEGAVRAREARPDLADTVPIIFSTITGNAYKLAAAVAEVVPDHVGPYNIRYINDEVIEKFDTFVLSYWCNHGTADDDTIELIRRMRGKNLIVIGTLGVARDSKHASDVSARVEALASENNRLLGHYLCRGSIDLRRTARAAADSGGRKGTSFGRAL